MKKIIIASIVLLMTFGLSTTSFSQSKTKAEPVAKEDVILGKWINGRKDAKFEIFKKDGKYFGKIFWLNRPMDKETGKPKFDRENSDAELAKRPIMGLVFLTDLVWDGDDEWVDGEIYDPKSGKTYDSYMWLENNDILKVKGFVGFTFIGKTDTWNRIKK